MTRSPRFRAVYDAVVAEVPELRTAPEKIGKAPRWTLLARVEVPQSKRVIKMYDAQGKEHKVELLGKGQQTVVAGIHPDTGQPYRYNGRGNVCELKRDDYPLLTVEQIARAMAAARRAMLAAGLKETKPGTTGGAQAHQSGAGSILKRTEPYPPLKDDDAPADLLEALRWSDCDDRGSWVGGLCALKSDDRDDRRELARSWSAKSDKFDDADFDRVWDSIKPPYRTSVGAIFRAVGMAKPQASDPLEGFEAEGDARGKPASRSHDRLAGR